MKISRLEKEISRFPFSKYVLSLLTLWNFFCMYLKEIKVDIEDSSWNANDLFAFSPDVKCNVYTAVFIFKLLLNNKSRNTFF